jgi:type II secretory pathway pseudopilin PulG
MSRFNRCRNARPGFNLFELGVVIIIMGILVGILLPALRGARIAARKSTTEQLLRSLAASVETFQTDKRSLPGFFSQQEMATTVNQNVRGFTQMKNLLLTLTGGTTNDAPQAGEVITVGPSANDANNTRVRLSSIGSESTGSGALYFRPDKSLFGIPQGLVASGAGENFQMPEVLDSFGQPIIAWVQADSRVPAMTAANTGEGPARFYWAPNASVLTSVGLGKERKVQLWRSINDGPSSMIGRSSSASTGSPPNPTGTATLHALVGNPASPNNTTATPVAEAARYPLQARGSIIFHSAGPDAIFMSSNDAGTGKHFLTSTPLTAPGSRVQYKFQTDVMKDYDDSIIATGN